MTLSEFFNRLDPRPQRPTGPSYDREFIPMETRRRDINPAEIAFLQYLTLSDAEQEARINLYREYYDGDHDTRLTDRLKSFLEIKGSDIEFNLNICPIPVDVLAERLQIADFTIPAEDENTPAGQQLTGDGGPLEEWIGADFAEVVDNTHTAALRDGDAFIIVSWDNQQQRPIFTFEPAYNGTYGVMVRYEESDGRRIKYAVKRWRTETGPGEKGHSRMNVYTADKVYKYTHAGGSWQPHEEPGEAWPADWTTASGDPIGIPVFHFRNNAAGTDHGRSELKDVIPVQNALNKALIDEIAAADQQGFPMLAINGEEPGADIRIGPGKLLWTKNPESKYYNIQGADLSGLSTLVKNHIVRAAQISRTPISYFQITGQIAAGDTQRADETGLNSKAERRSVYFGNQWSRAIAMARRLSNIYGRTNYPETPIKTVWKPFTRVNPRQEEKQTAETAAIRAGTLDALLMLNPTGDRYKLARIAGYSDSDAQTIAEGSPAPGEITP
jgi:hypothetical protein